MTPDLPPSAPDPGRSDEHVEDLLTGAPPFPSRGGISWVSERIAMGNHLDAQTRPLLERFGIRSILSLDGSLSGVAPDSVGVGRIEVARLIDGVGNSLMAFRRAVNLLGELEREAGPVLVQCHAGRSRTPAVVAAYLSSAYGMSPSQALQKVEEVRDINITPALRRLVGIIAPQR